jgi:hypothetical protein
VLLLKEARVGSIQVSTRAMHAEAGSYFACEVLLHIKVTKIMLNKLLKAAGMMVGGRCV